MAVAKDQIRQIITENNITIYEHQGTLPVRKNTDCFLRRLISQWRQSTTLLIRIVSNAV